VALTEQVEQIWQNPHILAVVFPKVPSGHKEEDSKQTALLRNLPVAHVVHVVALFKQLTQLVLQASHVKVAWFPKNSLGQLKRQFWPSKK
jgi:hypothetical protein